MIRFKYNGTMYQIIDQPGSDQDFQADPIADTLVLIGTGDSEYHHLGYSPPRRRISAVITSQDDYLGLRAAKGKSGTFYDDGLYSAGVTANLVSFQVGRYRTTETWVGTIVFELRAGL